MSSYVPNNRWRIISALVAISIGLSEAINVALNTIDFEFQWVVNPFSVVGMFGLLYFMFNRFIWKWSLLRCLDIVTIPDLSGIWSGEIKSSHDQGSNPLQVSVVINQQWSKILVELDTKESRSKSVAASFLTNRSSSPELVYIYVNEPKPLTQKSMEMHNGTARLALTGQCLEGDYYTGRGRVTVGRIRLTRSDPGQKF